MGCPKELYKLISEGDKDAVVRYMDRHKMTPQYCIDYNKKVRVVYDSYYPLIEAIKQGQLEIMNTLIERGFDPENNDYSRCDELHPIYWACRKGHLHIVKCLIEDHNINVNSIDRYENAPLLVAIAENHTDIVKYMIESGASLNNLNVLHVSVRYCESEMVEYILSKGVDVNARDMNLRTPLFETAECYFSYPKALVLLDAGADVDAKNIVGETTFLRAAEQSEVELMRLLISRGADANLVNNNGDTALHMTLRGMDCHEGLSYLVVELGLECLNTRNSRGITPISRALKYEHGKSVLELLVNYGCNITDEFDMLDDYDKEKFFKRIPNCRELFQHLRQVASQPRSLKDLASLKIRRHLGVHLQSAVKKLPLPEIVKDLIRIQKTGDDDDDDDNDEESRRWMCGCVLM